MKPCPSTEAGLQPGSNQEEILHSSIAASLGPLLPWPSHPSPLVVKLGPSPHPQVLVQFREGWKPAQQGGQSLNRSDGAVTSPPSSPVPLLAPQRGRSPTEQTTLLHCGCIGACGKEGRGGGVVPERPGECRELGAALAPGARSGQVGTPSWGKGRGSRGQIATFHSSHPPQGIK